MSITTSKRNSSILVTGGAGFIGYNLCQELLEQGNRVVAVDNLITSESQNIQKLQQFPNFVFVRHDITKPFPKFEKYGVTRFDYIYHLACPTGVPNLERLAEEMLLTCSVGTRNVLELAKKHNAAVLFTSSSEVYGDPEKFPQTEKYTGNVDSIGLRSPYEEGKRFSESLVAMYVRKYDLNAKIVRVFNTYGPGMADQESRVVPRFVMQAVAGDRITVQGNGSQTRTFCYVSDLVDGLQLVMKKGNRGEVYNIGGTKQVTMKDLAHMIVKATDTSSTINYVRRPSHDHKGRKPDITKIKKLGWKPKISLKKGIELTIKSLTEVI